MLTELIYILLLFFFLVTNSLFIVCWKILLNVLISAIYDLRV